MCGHQVWLRCPLERDLEALSGGLGHSPNVCCPRGRIQSCPAGQLPDEFMVMAIGVKQDHIFQGIIYGKPSHPLLRQAIEPTVGWNISRTYGPIYLCLERYDGPKKRKDLRQRRSLLCDPRRHSCCVHAMLALAERLSGRPLYQGAYGQDAPGPDGVSSTAHTGKGHSLRRRSRSMSLTPSTTELT